VEPLAGIMDVIETLFHHKIEPLRHWAVYVCSCFIRFLFAYRVIDAARLGILSKE
jgi:H+/Cl- antiporter ClcA